MDKIDKSFKTDFRPYRYKKAHEKFFCPLCKTQRAFTIGHKISLKNFGQIIIATAFVSMILYPFMGFESIYSFFAIWACFEIGLRANFRKEISCPHCGFDASWYRKDIRIAKKLVDDFWIEKKREQAYEAEVPSIEDALNASEIPQRENNDHSSYF
jgi:hypothetical protein